MIHLFLLLLFSIALIIASFGVIYGIMGKTTTAFQLLPFKSWQVPEITSHPNSTGRLIGDVVINDQSNTSHNGYGIPFRSNLNESEYDSLKQKADLGLLSKLGNDDALVISPPNFTAGEEADNS